MKKLILCLCIIIIGCQTKSDVLLDTINFIEETWEKEDLIEFSEKPESTSFGDVNPEFSDDLRRKIFENSDNSKVIEYFNSLGIKNENDIGSIISISLHRKLNNKPIRLKEQIKEIHERNASEKLCISNNKQRANVYFKNFKIQDTIFARFPINQHGNAVQYVCPELSSWVYDDDKDLIIKAVVWDRGDLEESTGKFFSVYVLEINKNNISFFSNKLNIGDSININLENTILE